MTIKKQTVYGVVLMAVFAVAGLYGGMPTKTYAAGTPGRCYLDHIGNESKKSVQDCSDAIPSGSDAAGKKLSASKCYSIYQDNRGSTYVSKELACDKPPITTAKKSCPNGSPAPGNDLSKCTDESGVVTSGGDPADGGDCATVSKCDLVSKYLKPFIRFLAALVGVAVVFSIIVGGIQYASSADDPQKVSAAKNRIRNAILALVTFIFLYAMLNFLIPGGLR